MSHARPVGSNRLLVILILNQFVSPVLTGNLTFTARARLLPCILGKAYLRPQKDLPLFSVKVGSAVEEDAQESTTICGGGRYKNTPRDGLDRGVLATFYLVSIFFTAS